MVKHGYLAVQLILFVALVCALAAPALSVRPWEVKTVLTLDGEAAEDWFGDSVCPAGDINGDGFMDFLVGARGNDAGGTDAGRAYLYLGGPNLDATPDLVLTGENAGDRLGYLSAIAGDVNADGYDDFIVSAYGYDNIRGRVYLHLGASIPDGIPDLVFDGEVTYGQFSGHSPVGDVNADGYDDFLISAGWHGGGRVYLYFGGPDLDNVADMVIVGPSGGEFGICLMFFSGGDFNDDGHNDIFIGAYKSDLSGFDSGGAWLYYGGPGLDAVPDLVFAPESSLEWFGGGQNDLVGDVNGDGHDDLMVSARAPYKSGCPGKLYLYLGGPAIDAYADMIFNGEAAGDSYGNVAGIGDVNQDGFDDFLVGAYRNDDAGTDAGKAYIYLGGSSMDNTAEITLTGEEAGDNFGVWVATVGDVNGDGVAEFAVGAWKNDSYATDAGRVYIYTTNPGFTPVGTNVVVRPVDSATEKDPVTITFDSVTVAGVTGLVISSQGPPPPMGFKVCSNTYYEMTTTAAYVGTIEVCIDYSSSGCEGKKNLKLKRFEDGGWIDYTTSHDPVNNIICGSVSSLSIFAVFVPVEITFDIKPRSCPNPLNIKWLENLGKKKGGDHAIPKKGGVIPAALVGNEDFDVTEVDISTLHLEGIEPLRTAYEDVTAPVSDGDECACTVAGPDGTLDLTMKFSRLEVAELVRYHERGDEVELTLTASFLDGTQFEASDCIIIVGKEPEPSMDTGSTEVTLGPVSPNPFNPWTMIGYYLPFDCSVTIEIYDVTGRRIASLLDGEQQSEGAHSTEWRGIDDNGRPVASGIYFCRLIVGKKMISQKIVLLR